MKREREKNTIIRTIIRTREEYINLHHMGIKTVRDYYKTILKQYFGMLYKKTNV